MNSDYPLLYCQQTNIIIKFSQIYLVVDVVSTHSNGVHDKLAPLVIAGSTIRNVVRVMFCSKVMTQLVCSHQVCFLDTSRSHVVIFFLTLHCRTLIYEGKKWEKQTLVRMVLP